ncbi:hypothetical protein [Okeania sp. KiyG1]|uniref:hypothetical protein n=1 Tax=Okeania sp. KiyG1 TaxID=2720165 RepID=UPI0019BA83EC|nr:hypothetical protein [Okeania sp. KiyG1]GGA35940.1 hypothetical protein CYANOKiyG1_53650 [Okeania sp. KiyG1]
MFFHSSVTEFDRYLIYKYSTGHDRIIISSPVASVLYNKGKEKGRGPKEEERGPKATLARKKPLFPVDIHPWFYTNDINGHDRIIIQ